MKDKFLMVIGLIWIGTGSAQATEQQGALVLYKEPLYEITDNRASECEGTYDIKAGKNVPDMRDFRLYNCEGRYTFTLKGNKGTTASLFGRFKYNKSAGFMVIVKTDNKKVWVKNLEDFPSGKWVNIKARKNSGGFKLFYRSKSLFSQNISSIKWGKWWKGETPE